jgi:hypothetical protein
MSKNASLGAYGIMYVIKYRRSEVVALLLKNGVVAPSNATDIQIGLLVTDLLKVSKSFYNEFSKLLINEDVIYGMSANMSGSYANMSGSYLNAEGDFCSNTANKVDSPTTYKLLCGDSKTTTKDSKTTTKEDDTPTPSWINKGLGLLQDGFKGYLQLDENKTKRELADASVKISSDEVTKETTKTQDDEGMSTGAIIGLSLLGVTVVGLVVYLITKNK